MFKHARRRAALLGGGLALSVLCLASPSAGAAAEPQPATDPDVAYLMDEFGLDEDTAKSRLAWQEEAVAKIEPIVLEQHPSFTAVALNNADATVTIYGTDASWARERAKSVALSFREPVVVARNSRQMDALGERVEARVLRSQRPENRRGASVSRDPLANRVTVYVSKSAAKEQRDAAQQAKRDESAGAVEVVEGEEVAQPSACTPSNCNPPMRGGLRIDNPRLDGRLAVCSTAFAVQSRVDGKQYVLTAAHCQNGVTNNASWSHTYEDNSSHYVGPRWNGVYSGDTDAMILAYNNQAGWNPQPWVLSTTVYSDGGFITQTGNSQLGVTGTYRNSEFVSGITLCKTGTTTNTTCGNTTGRYESIPDGEGHIVNNQVEFDACAKGGDSGGSVFRFSNGRAAGVLEGAATTNTCINSLGRQTAYFTRIESAQNALNVSVRTNIV